MPRSKAFTLKIQLMVRTFRFFPLLEVYKFVFAAPAEYDLGVDCMSSWFSGYFMEYFLKFSSLHSVSYCCSDIKERMCKGSLEVPILYGCFLPWLNTV